MHKTFLTLVFGGAVALMAYEAQAFPSAAQDSMKVPSDVIQVAGGCGPGWHRGPGGGCRPNRVVVVPGPRCFWRGTPRGPVLFFHASTTHEIAP
jgi:hypothetical protein